MAHRFSLIAAIRRLSRNEHGIALPMVLVIFLVGFALVTGFMVAIVGSAQVSSSTRTSVQTQAAVEAGIAAGLVKLVEISDADNDFCTEFTEMNDTTIQAGMRVIITAACDIATNPTQVTLTSEVKSDPGNETLSKMQAILPVTAGTAEQTVDRQRSVIIGNADLSALVPVSGDPDLTLSILIPDGNYECWDWNKRNIPGDLIVPNGDVSLGVAGCKVGGNVVASGNVKVQGAATVGGYVIAGGTGASHVYAGSKVGGDFTSRGSVAVQDGGSSVGGNVIAGGTKQSTLGAGAWIGGDFTARGSINAWGTYLIDGTLSANNPNALAMANDAIPTPQEFTEIKLAGWTEYAFSASAWQSAGYTQVASSCTQADIKSKIEAATSRSYILCPSWPGWGSLGTVSLKTDVAVITNGGSFGVNSVVRSADGAPHQFSVITSDSNLGSHSPSCTSPATGLSLTGIQVQSPMIMAVYTPCLLEFGHGTIRGAVIAGQINAWDNPTLVAMGVNLPGLNLAVDEYGHEVVIVAGVPEITGGLNVSAISQRNVD